jgi:hypothetical protein
MSPRATERLPVHGSLRTSVIWYMRTQRWLGASGICVQTPPPLWRKALVIRAFLLEVVRGRESCGHQSGINNARYLETPGLAQGFESW